MLWNLSIEELESKLTVFFQSLNLPSVCEVHLLNRGSEVHQLSQEDLQTA